MLVEEIKIQTSESTKTVKELRKELKDLRDQLLNTQKGTEEYSAAMQRAANIQKDLKDQMLEINNSAMDFGQKIGNCTKALTGISGAITAATGALSLFGIENEEAQKKITATMTSLIGITEGLSKLDDGIKAFKRLTIAVNASSKAMNGFKIALISTGIGALVVVLGSVIAYWDEFTEAIGLSSQQLEHLGDIARGVFNVITSSLKGIAQALGKMLKGDFQGAWDSLKNGFSVVKNFNEGVAASEAKREAERTKKAQEEAAKRAKIAEDEYKKRIEAAQKLAKYERDMDAAKTRGAESDRYSQGAYDRQMKYFDRLFAVYRKDSDEYKNLVLEKEQFLQDWENHFIEEAKKEEEANAEKARKSQEAAEREALRAQEERQRLLEGFDEDMMTEQEKLDARYQLLIDAATKEGEDTTAIHKWYEEEKTRITKENEDKQTAIRKAGLKAYGSIANGVSDILNAIGDMMEESSDEQKGLQTAAVIISTLVGMMQAIQGGNAMAAQMGLAAPVGWALGAVQAAATLATGIATIAQINSVSKDGSGSISGGAFPSINMGAAIAASPDFTQSVDGAMTQTAITDQKVYVLEHDITETQNKVEVAESRATY